ncbi:MAG TPA: type VI secretion system tube protein Hcp [Verrucomicrobiae bacterium]|jgi:type VI secretion system secreted protein Hcp
MASNASAEYFLKIDGVNGESQKDGYQQQIEIESFSWGATQTGGHAVGGGGGVGGVNMGDFQFTTKMNSSSPVLMQGCASGKPYPTAVLTARKAGGSQQAYLTWTLSNVFVSSYNTGGSGGSDAIPMDSFSLSFSKVVVSYKPQNNDGSLGAAVPGGFDLQTMKVV